MSNEITCRLCLEFCNEGYCDLYNESCEMDSDATVITTNEVFELVKKYFPEELLNMECSKHLTKLCLNCWHYIEEFHNFQENIILAQSLKMSENIELVEEVHVEETPDPGGIPIKFEEYNDSELDVQEEAEEQQGEMVVEEVEEDENLDDYIVEEEDIQETPDSYTDEASEIYEEEHLAETPADTTSFTNLSMNETLDREDVDIKTEQHSVNELQTIEEYDAFIGNWKSSLKCNVCNEQFPTYSGLCEHFKVEHPGEDCHIICCDLQLYQHWEIVEHILDHKASGGTHKCHICFQTVANVERHIQEKHAPKPAERYLPPKKQIKKDKLKIYQCKICDKMFFDNSALRVHREAEHQQETDIHCTFCSETFSQFNEYESHLKDSHQRERQMKRNQEAFEMLPEIRKHLAVTKLQHKKLAKARRLSKPRIDPSVDLKCPICGNTYHSKRYLRNHMTMHGGKANYLCQFCSKSYHLPNSLSHHIRLKHSGLSETPVTLKCHICGKLYYTQKAFRQHLSMHEGKPMFSCKICGKQYFFSSSLSNHLKYYHNPNKDEIKARAAASSAERRKKRCYPPEGDPMECHICNKVYYTKKALTQHLTKHEGKPKYSCKLCNKQYFFSSSFSNHMKFFHAPNKPPPKKPKPSIILQKAIADGKPVYKCPTCDNIYLSKRTLREHETTHIGQQSYTCKFCPQMFYLKSSMYNHMRKMHDYHPVLDASMKKGKNTKEDGGPIETLDDLVESLDIEQTGSKGKKKSKKIPLTTGLQCSHCDKFYQTKRSLKEHEAKHTGVELYSCKFCEKKFFLKSTMSIHIKRDHNQGVSLSAMRSKKGGDGGELFYNQEQQFAVSAITEEEIDVVTEEVITSSHV
ncbi:uncharacterized protein [Musca autumnalis]|uniref:uncharacterized protein n=1 Tax=Musca autumnalis TaxID=221902 RepID=UPI003CE75C9D